MIPRYTRPDMAKIWEPENRFRIWLDIETHAAQAMEDRGTIPAGVAKALRERGAFDVERIDEIEREVKHDVIAFLTSVAEHVGEEARFMHQGMTSSDVLDTCFSVQLKQSADMLLAGMDRLLAALEKRAKEHKHTITVGRSHGIHAEPTTFGLKLSGHYAAFKRCRARLEAAQKEVSVCMISGPVGTYASVDPAIEQYVAKAMGLTPEDVSTQVIPRDRHAAFFAALAIAASCIENLATEIRHLQRSEVREAEEFFSKGQKGSSAMPHKRNPVLTENLTGLARVIRAALTPALENVTLWHERDISHSSAERIMAPDACIAADFALHRLTNVVENLVVYPDRMQANLDALGGVVFSQRVLLALTQAGISREDSYRIVQRNAMAVWDSKGAINFRTALGQDADVTAKLDATAIDALFDTGFYARHVDGVFKKLFG